MANMPYWALILYYAGIATILIAWPICFAGWLLQLPWLIGPAGWTAAIAFAGCWLLNNGFHLWNRIAR
jgi:hypothetical protein